MNIYIYSLGLFMKQCIVSCLQGDSINRNHRHPLLVGLTQRIHPASTLHHPLLTELELIHPRAEVTHPLAGTFHPLAGTFHLQNTNRVVK